MADSCGKICMECGEHEFVLESSNLEEQVVCRGCGTVRERCLVLESYDNDNSVATETSKQRPRKLTHSQHGALNELHSMAESFDYGPGQTAEAVELYEAAVTTNVFKVGSAAQKASLAGCCIFVIARRCHFAHIQLVHISKLSGIPMRKLMATYEILQGMKQFKLDRLQFEQNEEYLINTTVNALRFEPSEKIKQQALGLIGLCRLTQIATGVLLPPLVTAAIQVARNGAMFSKMRNYPMLHTISKQLAANSRTAKLRLREITLMLVKLASQVLVHERGKISEKNAHLYLDLVLTNPSEIIRLRERESQPSILSEILAMRPARPMPEEDPAAACSSQLESSPVNSVETDSEELNEIDVADEDIDQYIRTDDEVAFIQAQHKKLLNRNI